MDVPCANPIVPTMQEAVEVPQVRFHDRVADDPVGTQVPDWEEPVAIHDTNKLLNDCDELIPKWLNVVKGLVNSEDFPLNIYQETLLQNKILRVVRRNYVTKYLEMLAEIAELKDDYEKFYEQYGKCRNDEDSTVGVKTAELLTFNTSKPGGKRISFKEYVYRMTQEQNDVYYITGENIAVVSSSPFEENLRKKGLEEHHVADPMDEYAVYQFKESDGTKLNPTTKKGRNLGDEDEKKTLEELKVKLEPSTKLMKDVLGDKVEMVIASDRIIDSPCVLTTSEYGWSAKIERITETQALRDSSMTSHMVFKKTMEVNPTRTTGRSLELKSRQDLHGHLQQQHKSNQHQPTKKQSAHQERGGESKKERDQEGRKEEERKVEERGSERVKKDAMDWTVVARKKKRKTVQIFVKVDGSKVAPMEVSLSDDKVEDVMRRIQNDEDAYVTMHGRVLKKGERLKSCGVTDGCIVQVTSRLRGRGKHKDKKGQKERKRAAKPQGPEQKAVQGCDRDAAIRMIEENEESRKMMVRMLEENEDNQKMIESMSEGSDVDMEQTLQNYRTACRDVLGWDREQVGMMERGLRWAVEARRKERREEQEQRRQEEQEEEQRREEQEQRRQEQQEETRAESTDEPEVTRRPVEVRTGRGSAGLVRGEDGRHLADESNRKGKGKGKVEEEEYRWDAKRKVVRMMKREEDQEANEEEQGRVAPNMGAGGSHPQATSDPREARALSWADCKDEKETTEERPPGLEEEEMENEPKTQQEEKLTQVESEQEAREEETRAQEARELKRAQEAREEERKAQEAREEQRRAQEAREEQKRAQEAREEQTRAQEAREEQKRAQEAREEQKRAQEAREEQRAQEAREEQRAQEAREEQRRAQEAQDEKRAQEEQERLAREAKAQEERREQDREAVTQEGHEGEVKAQEEQGEEANSLHEGSHVSDRHMTWWRNAWWVRVNNGPHLQTARDRRRVWRAATRAAQEVRETGKVPGREREEWEKRETESNTLHVIFHFNPTAAAAAASAATVRLQ